MVRVLCHLNADAVDKIAAEFPDVEFACIAREGELDPDISGDVLLTSAIGAPTLEQALDRGVRWIHTIGTGVDRFPLELIRSEHTLTCSRGASAIAIAEWSSTLNTLVTSSFMITWPSRVARRSPPMITPRSKRMALMVVA